MGVHRAELVALEAVPVEANALMAEKSRTTRFELNGQRHEAKDRGEQQKPSDRADQIHHPLEKQLPPLEGGPRQLNERLPMPPHCCGMYPSDLNGPRHRQHLPA